MSLIPKLYKVEIDKNEQGLGYYRWLWFSFTKKYDGFNVSNRCINFTKPLKNGVIIECTY